MTIEVVISTMLNLRWFQCPVPKLPATVSDINPGWRDCSSSDDDLRRKTASFQERLANAAPCTTSGQFLMRFCLRLCCCSQGEQRVLGMRHFDVQLIAAWFYMKARSQRWKPVKERRWLLLCQLSQCAHHRCACCDRERLPRPSRCRVDGPVHRFLGLSVGLIQQDMRLTLDANTTAISLMQPTRIGFWHRATIWPLTSVRWWREFSTAWLTRLIRFHRRGSHSPIISRQVERPQEKYQQAPRSLRLSSGCRIG